MGGKIAQIGSRLIDSAASKIAEDFFRAFEAHLRDFNTDHVVPGESLAAPATSSPKPIWWALATLVTIALAYWLMR